MLRALIVDDEPMQIQGLLRHIAWEKLGYESPLTAESGEEALALLETTPVDVLITDVSMPGMTGIELLAKCRSDYPHLQSLQTVIVSGFDEFEFVQEAIHLGAKAYVLKPVKTEELEQKLASFRSSIEQKDRIEREMESLKGKMTESLDMLQDRFANDLIEGRAQSGEMIDSWRRLLELPGGEWRIRLYVFAYDRLQDSARHDAARRIWLSDALLRAVKTGLSGFEHAYVGRTGTDEAAILHLNAPPSERARIEKQFPFVQEVVRESSGESVTVGVSRECGGPGEVPTLYKEVKHMMTRGRMAGAGHIHYFDRAEASDYREFALKEEEIPEIVRLFEQGEADQATARVHLAFDSLETQPELSFSYVQAFAMGLVSELARRIPRSAEKGGEFSVRSWQRLLDCASPREVRETVLEALSRYRQLEDKEQAQQRHHLIHQVASFLEDRLREPVTVKQLAERFQLNPSYLSVLFKRETGKTISEFVQEARIGKAKRLLQDPNVKVYEVAEQVGFQTTAYFSFLFKKATGVTPQEFRDYHYGE